MNPWALVCLIVPCFVALCVALHYSRAQTDHIISILARTKLVVRSYRVTQDTPEGQVVRGGVWTGAVLDTELPYPDTLAVSACFVNGELIEDVTVVRCGLVFTFPLRRNDVLVIMFLGLS